LVFFGGVARETRAGVRVQGSEVRGTAAAAKRRRGQGSGFRGQEKASSQQPKTLTQETQETLKGARETRDYRLETGD
jgi:hypothetical protein